MMWKDTRRCRQGPKSDDQGLSGYRQEWLSSEGSKQHDGMGGWIDVISRVGVVLNVGGRKQLEEFIGSPSAHANV